MGGVTSAPWLERVWHWHQGPAALASHTRVQVRGAGPGAVPAPAVTLMLPEHLRSAGGSQAGIPGHTCRAGTKGSAHVFTTTQDTPEHPTRVPLQWGHGPVSGQRWSRTELSQPTTERVQKSVCTGF